MLENELSDNPKQKDYSKLVKEVRQMNDFKEAVKKYYFLNLVITKINC